MRNWLTPLQRKTTSGSYMPEVDFLRFIAITAVVLFHIHGFLIVKQNRDVLFGEHLDYLFRNGDLGVQLFFVLSGFILALPFAKGYFLSSEVPTLKKFYVRRLTRLEPPYILLMTLLLPVVIFHNKWLIMEAVKSYLYSIGYIHNLLAGDLSKLIVVTWSLEIEIFFYILFPALALAFRLPKFKRRLLLLVSMCFSPYLNYNILELEVQNVLGFFQYFAAGMLLADIYLTEKPIKLSQVQNLFVLIVCPFILFTIEVDKIGIVNYIIYPLLIIGFYYLVLSNAASFKIYSNKYLASIGGMCYSMYLIHYIIISAFGNYLQLYVNSVFDSVAFFILISIIILIGTVIFYLLFEKPFMNPNWYKVANKRKNKESLVKTTA
ncbi:acyltransferase family protein [Pontibacter pudoricolor]|uniref:acyltransferase family protein n=1 Tax=Pontibacter pudoricolor TaxID=2694930 RepID=UPI0013909625|nr:acyltransferase [Pontibacter pudoricolor]